MCIGIGTYLHFTIVLQAQNNVEKMKKVQYTDQEVMYKHVGMHSQNVMRRPMCDYVHDLINYNLSHLITTAIVNYHF